MNERFKTRGFAQERLRAARVSGWVARLVGCGALAVPAWAQSEPTFELSVVRLEGAASCPSATVFESRVAARLGRIPFAEPSQRSIETLLSRRGDAWRAEITLRDANGIVQGRREIEAVGADCSPLAEATTFALALTVDPDAVLGSLPAGSDAEPSHVAPPSAPVDAPPPPARPCPVPNCPAAPPCPRPACPPTPPAPYLAASARAVLALGLVPRAAPGMGLNAEAGSETVSGHLGLFYLPETFADDPRFAFGLTTAAAGACALFHPRDPFELGLCGEIQLGSIHAVVRDALPVDPGDELWFAGALGTRLRLLAFQPFVFEAGVSAIVPILDRRFDVAGIEGPVFQPAAVGALGFAGVGMRAP